MSNLYKSAYVVQKESESRVIDSNDMVAKKIQHLTEIMEAQLEQTADEASYEGFVEGLDAVQVESLLGDQDAPLSEENVPDVPSQEEQIASAREELEQLKAQADAVVEDAKENAKQIVAKAEADAGKIADDARRTGYDEGYNSGYQEGFAKAKEAEDKLYEQDALRQQEYEKALAEMEPMLVGTLCDIYEHVLGIELAGRSDVVMHLLSRALRTIEGGVNFLVHVSSEDYPYVTEHKDELSATLGSVNTLEIIEDITLSQGKSFIETESGIYDCGLGVEMELLKKELKLLSRDDN